MRVPFTTIVFPFLFSAACVCSLAKAVEFTSDTEEPAIAELDGDPAIEVVTLGRYAHNSYIGLRIFDSSSGALEFEWYPNPADGYSDLNISFPPLILDPDRDGQADLIIQGDASMNGSWIRAWHWFKGSSHTLSVKGTSSGVSAPVLAQTDGDPAMEMVLFQGDPGEGADRLVVIDGTTGEPDFVWTPATGEALTSFSVLDVDSDLMNEILVTGIEPGDFHHYRHYIIQTSGLPAGVTQAGSTPGLEIGTPRPNPSSSGAVFALSLNEPSSVTIRVIDVAGRLVSYVLDDALLPAGTQTMAWSGHDSDGDLAPVGVYFAEVTAGTTTEVRRIVLVR